MPIFYDRIADQVEDLLPDFFQEDGPRFINFLKAYFEFLEKGQLVYKDAADIDYIGLEDGTVSGEALNVEGQRGNMIQETGTYAPSSITNVKIIYEHDVDSGKLGRPTSFQLEEYVVGSSSGAIARIDVIGSSSNLHIEQFSEAQFDIDEIVTGMTSGMTATVAKYTASPLHAANNLLSYADVDKTSGDFLEYFRRDFMPLIDRDVKANKRLLQKHIQDLYLAKGTKESYEFLFRILYGLEAEITFPTENVIRPSESEFVEPTVMRLYSTKDLKPFKGGTIKKLLGTTVISRVYINDIYGISGTNDALDGYEAELILPYVGSFSAGETVIISDRDGFRTDVTATIRGIMIDVDPTESSIYVGLEDNKASDIEDNIRLENSEVINLITEDLSETLIDEDENKSNLILEYSVGSDLFDIIFFELEDGTQTGVASSGKLLIDAISISADGEALGGATYDSAGVLVEDNAFVHEQPAGYPHITDAPDSRYLPSGDFHMGGGIYQEQASLGALYSESDNFNYKSPLGGTATQSINVIGAIGRGEVTDVIIDDVGTSYITGDKVIFNNAGTDGLHATGEIVATTGLMQLERGTGLEPLHQRGHGRRYVGLHTFTGDGSNTIFSGVSIENRTLGFDPRKVKVFLLGAEATENADAVYTELAPETGFTTDQSGGKIVLATPPGNGIKVEIESEFEGILLEDALRPPLVVKNIVTGLPERDPDTDEIITKEVPYYLANESAGQIRTIKITEGGINYKSPPEAYIGGYIYYNEMTAGTSFPVGALVTSSNGVTMKVLSHNTDRKRVTVYKRPTDPGNVPTGSISYGSGESLVSCVILQTDVTQGYGAKLWGWGDRIGSVQKLKMQDVGHDFDEGGIGNYKQNAIVKNVSAALVSNTTVTANLTGTSADIHTFDGDKNILSLKNVKGIFNDGDYCTTSDSKNFVIGKISPCTARGKLGGVALLDGNYTNDTGFPSVDSQRIHDGEVYQDFSYKIKVGKSINEYRSIIKSLLSPAGTIFFGEVAIRQSLEQVEFLAKYGIDDWEAIKEDARYPAGPWGGTIPDVYNVNFDGDTTTRSFVPRLIIGSRQDTADLILEDGSVPGGVMAFTQVGSTGSGAVAGVYTFEPRVDESLNQGLEFTIQIDSATTFSNLKITNRGSAYTLLDNIHITRSMVGGSGNTIFASFKVTEVGDSLVTSNSLQFVGGDNNLELETGEGIMTTERFLAITSTTIRDQASGILYTSISGDPGGAQSYIVGEKFTPSTKDFFNRQLVAQLSPKGHRVHKELVIEPSYNQHKISYTTLSNALAVGTKVRGATSNALGIVMQHDTTNKFIIVHRDQVVGKAGSQFSGTEIIQNILTTGLSSTNYFTATSIELHWTPEDIVTKREPTAITADTYITSQAQKTASAGGGEVYDHTESFNENYYQRDIWPNYEQSGSTQNTVSRTNELVHQLGKIGRGKVLVVTDPNETYDSEMKQRKITIVSSPIYSSSATQRGRSLSAGNHTKTPLNQRGADSYVGGVHTSTTIAGDTAPPYLAINGTALRLDDIRNSVSEQPGDSSVTVLQDTGNSNTSTTRTTNRTGVNISSGVNWGYRPAGQKLFESTNFISENIISEAGETFLMEDYQLGRIEISSYPGDKGGILLNEDDTKISYERGRAHPDEIYYLASEESTQIGSYNLISESGERIIDESNSRFLSEEALMIGRKESNQSGPTIGDLGDMMFTENYGIMNKVYEEDFYVLDETDSDNILMEDNTLLVSESDDIMLETGEHMLQESPSEGLRINDISSMYPNRLISNLERELGRKTNLNHSAVVQTG